jgi:predicted nucleotide-binding protein
MSADFPKVTLEQALRLPEALQRNGGQPLPKIDMATALGISPGSSALRTLGSASSSYGLTGGSYKTEFTMDDFGTKILAPKSEEEKASTLVDSALNPEAFRKVFDYYKGKKFPETQFLINTLKREFEVAESQATAFAEIFTTNMKHVGLIRATTSGDWLSESLPSPNGTAGQAIVEIAVHDSEQRGNPDRSIEIPAAALRQPVEPKPKRPNVLFIGHGKNKKPLEQLTKTLRELGIPHIVAEDEPNENRAISKKVRDTMEKCGAAILIFSADEEYFDKDGNSVWKPSENVDHELGAASILYGERVIMFKEESVNLASNFSGTGYISFEKDKLNSKTNELLRELIAMKILRVAVDE